MSATEFLYVDTAVGGVHNRNDVRRKDEFRPNGQPDVFATYRRFTADFEEYTRNNTQRTGEPSVSGYDGPSLADFYPLDFDNKSDLQAALNGLRRALLILRDRWRVPLEALRIYFSGYKGFSVEIPGRCFGGFESEAVRKSAERFKRLLGLLFPEADELHLDRDIYDALRLWRVPNTRHGKSNLYKIPLTVEEVFDLSAKQIKELARKPRRLSRPEVKIEPIPPLMALWKQTTEPNSGPRTEPGDQEGDIIRGGERNTRMTSRAGSLRQLGLSEEAILAVLLVENREKCVPPLDEAEVRKIAQSVARYEPGKGSDKRKEPRQSQADMLVKLAEGDTGMELFHTPSGEAFASFRVGEHRENWLLKSKAFRQWIARLYYERHSKTPRSQALHDAINVLTGKAMFDGTEMTVYTRLAEDDGAIYLDLANERWEGVRVTADGWEVVKGASVRFRRPHGMLSLPKPIAGGSVEELRKFVNIRDEDWPLLLGWLIAAIRPSGPYPVLDPGGEQGAGKTTLSRVLRSLIDPNSAGLRPEPRDVRDLIIAATNGWVISLDNLSRVPPWLSDALCRIATGGGFGSRQLFTDDEEALFDVQRPVIVNGIEEIVTRPDLLDRAIVLSLPSIPEEKRRSESEFWRDFEEARPRILGALLDAMACGLRNLPTTHLDRLPRMADFALWTVAAEPGLGLESGSFIKAYSDNRSEANDQALRGSSVATAVLTLLEGQARWEGTATDLLNEMEVLLPDYVTRSRSWPKSAQGLSNGLRRVLSNLRQSGIKVEFRREGKEGKRTILLERVCKTSSEPSEPTAEGRNPSKHDDL